jgi:hypothetical protein
VTSNAHGLETGDKVEMRNIVGPTGFNYGTNRVYNDNGTPNAFGTNTADRRYWTITKLSDDQFTINDSKPSLSNVSGVFSSTGAPTAQCLDYGCARTFYKENAASYMASTCLVERPGGQSYTDASTSGAGQVQMSLLEFAAEYFKDILAKLRTGRTDYFQWKVREDVATDEYWTHLDAEVKRSLVNKRNGKTTTEWQLRSERCPNHLLDCEVMQIALASVLGMFTLK